MPFETEIKVRFSDVDRAGIAYYPRVVHWLHIAFEEFWERFVGATYATVLEKDNLGFPSVKLDVEFKAPSRFGEVLTIQVGVEEIGRSSSRFRYAIVGPAGDVRVTARVTVVCVDFVRLTPTPLPAKYRERFTAALVS